MSPPPAAGVAVVGAGITGLSVAWHALGHGLGPVVVYERQGIGAGASGVQPGGVRQQWGTEVNCLLARESLAFYRELHERLRSRVDPVFRSCGYIFLAHSEPALARLEANVALQRRLGIPSRAVAPDEAAEIVPGLRAEAIMGASYCPEDGYFDRPQAVVEAFAEAAGREGAAIERVEVVGLRAACGDWELELADGREARAEQVVVAAGADSARLLAGAGIELPIRPERRFLFLGEPIRERLLEPLVVSPERRFAAKQLADGRLLASDLGAAGDPAEGRERWRGNIRAALVELLPQLEFVPLPLLVEGTYDMTPDRQAAVGPLPGRDGLFVAAGFSGHGFMIAPAVGAAVADLLAGDPPPLHVGPLSPGRFERGELVPEPQVV